jgi:hypothetical protein
MTMPYILRVSGCDDSTTKLIDFTPEQLEVVEWLRDQINPHAGGCKPSIDLIHPDDAEVEWINMDEARNPLVLNTDWRADE